MSEATTPEANPEAKIDTQANATVTTPVVPAAPAAAPKGYGDAGLAAAVSKLAGQRETESGTPQVAPDAVAALGAAAQKTVDRVSIGIRVFILQRDINLPPNDDLPNGYQLSTGSKITERGLDSISLTLKKRMLSQQAQERVPTLVVVGSVSEEDYAIHGEGVCQLVGNI